MICVCFNFIYVSKTSLNSRNRARFSPWCSASVVLVERAGLGERRSPREFPQVKQRRRTPGLRRGHSHGELFRDTRGRSSLNPPCVFLNGSPLLGFRRQERALGDAARETSESDPEDFADETNPEPFYGSSPPSTPRQMKRMSAKLQRNSLGRPAGRAGLKGESRTWQGAHERTWPGWHTVCTEHVTTGRGFPQEGQWLLFTNRILCRI